MFARPAYQFLLIGQLFAESPDCTAQSLEEDPFRICNNAPFLGEHACWRTFLRGARLCFIGRLLGRGYDRQLTTRRTLQQRQDHDRSIDLIGALKNPINASITIRSRQTG